MIDIKKLRAAKKGASEGPYITWCDEIEGKDYMICSFAGCPNKEDNMKYFAAAANALPKALDEIERLQKENEAIKKAIENTKNNNPYPTDIFPELSKEELSKLREVFKEKGISQIRLYTSWGRHVWDDCLQEIESFLEVKDDGC